MEKEDSEAEFTENEITEESIFSKVEEYKKMKETQDAVAKKLKELRNDILYGLAFLDIKKLKNEEHEASVSYPKAFDQGLLKLDNRELYDKFTTIETITTEQETFDKREFQKRFPEEYEKYLVEMTPRLTVK